MFGELTNVSQKILSLPEMQAAADRHRAAGQRVVLCDGDFSLLHIGHIRQLNEARRHGDLLLVTVTPGDGAAQKQVTVDSHMVTEVLASLACIDYVAVNPHGSVTAVLDAIRPDVLMQGHEDTNGDTSSPRFDVIRRCCHDLGIELIQNGEIDFHSAQRINRFLFEFPTELAQYLKLFRRRYQIGDVEAWLLRMADLRVLVVGDTILDDYHYCHTLGTSSKDPVLVAQLDSSDMFGGGVLAAANHLAGFADFVTLGTILGERDRHEDFIRRILNRKVDPTFFTQPGAPTLIKRRFVEGYSLTKMFEVYIMDDRGMGEIEDRRFCDWLEAQLPEHDLVVVNDFGHGAISSSARRVLAEKAPFLCVNTQSNAGNRGFHTIGRYPRADLVSIAEHELKLEMRDLQTDVKRALKQVTRRLGCRYAIVTRGKKGCVVCHGDGSLVEVPAFAQKVVDRIGAGDAFFTVTSLAAFLGAPPELIGFIGNVVGSLAVEIIGNKQAVTREDTVRMIRSLITEG